MRADTKENLALVGKSLLVAVGGILFVGATVDLVVAGPSVRSFGYLVVGLALCLPPLALAFRNAVRHAKQREP